MGNASRISIRRYIKKQDLTHAKLGPLQALRSLMVQVKEAQAKKKVCMFTMLYFQTTPGYVNTLEEGFECGTACCIAGYAGLLPEFKEFGGTITDFGEPTKNGAPAPETMSEFLGLPLELTTDMIYVGLSFWGTDTFSNVKIDHAIYALDTLIAKAREDQHV